jgi:hypothetical protein
MTVAVFNEFSALDLQDLRLARDELERPNFTARAAGMLGAPTERLVRLLPRGASQLLAELSERAVRESLSAAVGSLQLMPARPGGARRHRLAAMATGAFGGLFGLPAVALELPATTLLMLRAIAAIAAEEGERLDDPATRLACLEVFALGGRTRADDAARLGYYEIRLGLGAHFSRGAGATAALLSIPGLPPAAVLIRAIASRFGIVVSQKMALQLVPLVGAATGAAVNAAFMRHFQTMAHGHFTLRRLERRYGPERVRAAYAALAEPPGSGQPMH